MSDDNLFFIYQIMSMPPWGLFVYISVPAGLAGVAVQVIGLIGQLSILYKAK